MDDPRPLPPGVALAPTGREHAAALARLQRLVFPTLAAHELFGAEHYLRHVERFPEGQLVALAGGEPVAATTTLRLGLAADLRDHPRRFADVFGDGSLATHDPAGSWLYGADVSVHPAWRRRGIARALYSARQRLVRRLGLRGQVTVGMLSGFAAYSVERTPATASIEEYARAVLAGERQDPTVGAQLALGFEARGVALDYLDDPGCGNAGILLVLPAARDVAL